MVYFNRLLRTVKEFKLVISYYLNKNFEVGNEYNKYLFIVTYI
jgi:hypothetical protein